MSRCALVGAVDFNAEHFEQQSFDYVIAVDKGYEYLRDRGIESSLVLGDFDSLGYVPVHPHIKRFPEQKNESDIELALHEAAARGFDELYVYGCLAKRLDHTYGVLQLLAHFSRRGIWTFGIGDDFACVALTGQKHDTIRFGAGAEGTLSAFAVSDVVTGVMEEGLHYPLHRATLTNDKPLGVSNELCGTDASVSVEEGTLLVFFPLTAWKFLTF